MRNKPPNKNKAICRLFSTVTVRGSVMGLTCTHSRVFDEAGYWSIYPENPSSQVESNERWDDRRGGRRES